MTDLPEHINIPDSLLRGAITKGNLVVAVPDPAGNLIAVDVANSDLAFETGKKIAEAGGTAYIAEAEISMIKAFRPRVEITNDEL